MIYKDSLMTGADYTTFEILGSGYAKDKSHVYLNGRILDKVNPATFSLIDSETADTARPQTTEEAKTEPDKAVHPDDGQDAKPSILDMVLGTDDGKNNYTVAGGHVTYNGKAVKNADAATFKYVGGEYAADKNHAYYKGKVLSGAWGIAQFKYRGNGTATDGVNWYANGKPVDRD